ncbi:hypothetical protein I8U24_10475 [Thermoactinomyces sp. CICC 24226]|uniref:hypothetical protein n=1 Tax=Thermoactinomyces sp. CICC 24226 TaxID=2767431 RepID=UPI0018DCF15A|nr:hypothetical protein [Thermoactinomyces sp. CICC 24226]MBI0392535.1 hypothetical protein [Thermoactinomyces sp. CICC 24226]
MSKRIKKWVWKNTNWNSNWNKNINKNTIYIGIGGKKKEKKKKTSLRPLNRAVSQTPY